MTAADPRTTKDALADGLRRARDMDYRVAQGELPRLHWTKRIARLAALVLPFDEHGVGRDLAVAARRGGMPAARRVARSLTGPPGFAMTVVSRKRRCVWLRLPKAASESILAAMLAADPECEIFRMDYGKIYELRPEAREWFTFAFVRHPFSRALSFWSEIHFAHERYGERADHQKRKTAFVFERRPGLAETRDFDAYCRWLGTPYAADSCADKHIVSQSAPIRSAARGRGRQPDFIGRMESLDADWSRVAARAGLPIPKLPLLHSSVGWDAGPEAAAAAGAARARLLTERNMAVLAARYADDLELGGYAPDGLRAIAPPRFDIAQPGAERRRRGR